MSYNKRLFFLVAICVGGTKVPTGQYIYIQVVVLASLAQLLVFVELARCARSIQIEIKDAICM